MFLTYLMLFVALCLSTVAAFYSIVGLTAIFAAAVMPIVLMGSILEVAKLTVTVWLHEYWSQAKLTMKLYLVPAVGMLMLITSMGIFGFLSKAHSDQSMVSGDVQAKIAVYDEKIKTAKENIDANRKALKQMDEAVDQVMGRSTDEKGADKAVALRRSQQKERGRLLAEIETYQKTVSSLNEERAPIAAEVRKVEAEVGPIKYIAALIYDDNPDANVLEKAVRWVIILLVIVFDPLAVMMLLAATESMKWEREKRNRVEPAYEPDNGPLTDEQVDQIKESVVQDPAPPGWMFDKFPYLRDGANMFFKNTKPMVSVPAEQNNTPDAEENDEEDSAAIREAKRLWKVDNPNKTLKEQRRLFDSGKIDKLPWMDYIEETPIGFGTTFPADPRKGDMFIRTDHLPTQLFKFNGSKWIEVDKTLTDYYTHNNAYIDHLIAKISTGEYDPDLLNDNERAQLELRLKQDN